MIVKEKNENIERSKVGDISSGDCFMTCEPHDTYLDKNYWITTTEKPVEGPLFTNHVLCVNLKDGSLKRFDRDQRVIPVIAEMHVEK